MLLSEYPYVSLSDGAVWFASQDRDLPIKDVRIVSEGIVSARVADGAGAGLELELVWIHSDLAYGPHWDITWISPKMSSRAAWDVHVQRVEAVFPMARA